MNCIPSTKGELATWSSPRSPLVPLTVDQEYNNVLRTKSFLNIWKKTHHNLKITTSTAASREVEPEHCRGSKHHTHLLDSLLDPGLETLLAAATNPHNRGHRRLRRLLRDYLDATMDACIACTTLLSLIDNTRTHHLTFCRLLLQLCTTPIRRSSTELSTHLQTENPLSPTNLTDFHGAHSLYNPLSSRLASACRRICRQRMIIKASKYGGAVVCSVVAVAAVVVAVHSVVGIAFLPLVAALVPRWARSRVSRRQQELAVVDAAAKGAYIVGRDLDTLSRMVRRLHDKMEHETEVGLIAMRNCKERKIVREVVREMECEEEGFREQLEELEEHVYLCLLTIVKCRELVVQAMGGAARAPPPEEMA